MVGIHLLPFFTISYKNSYMKTCSIIIPHHNLVSLLKRSLDSIPNRPDFEVIVVDDNSDAESIAELKSLKLNENIRILYTKEGKGAGYARNRGIEIATGKWLLFCDSDDYFTSDMPKLVEEYADSDFDAVFFGFQTVDSDTLELMPTRVIGSERALKNKDIEYFKYRFHGPWAKLVKKSLLDKYQIRCDEVICSNDTFLAGMIGYHADKSIVDQRIIYVTTVRQGSLVHSMNEYSLLTRIEVSLKYNRFLREIDKNKYRINMISLFAYLHTINRYKFNKYIFSYLKEESCRNIFHDLKKSIFGFLNQKFHKGTNMRKQIKVTRL